MESVHADDLAREDSALRSHGYADLAPDCERVVDDSQDSRLSGMARSGDRKGISDAEKCNALGKVECADGAADTGAGGGSDKEKAATPVRVFKVSMKVRLGGATLAWCAGITNSVAFHELSSFVSHTTGTLTKVGLGAEDSNVANAGDGVLLLMSFVLGSISCGFLIGKNTIHFGLALYDFVLIGISTLLVLATTLAHTDFAKLFASAACGLQNGMATQWGGAVLRTTHVTGLFTDVGLLVGRILSMLCRKRCGQAFDAIDNVEAADDLSKLSVLVPIATCFLIGVIAGSYFQNAIGVYAFLVPAAITGATGVAYMVYRVFVLGQRFFSDAEMEVVDVSPDIFPVTDSSAHHSPRGGTVTRAEFDSFLAAANLDHDSQVSFSDLLEFKSAKASAVLDAGRPSASSNLGPLPMSCKFIPQFAIPGQVAVANNCAEPADEERSESSARTPSRASKTAACGSTTMTSMVLKAQMGRSASKSHVVSVDRQSLGVVSAGRSHSKGDGRPTCFST
mmetsp:Transcript_75931/g.210808  ORF Transcript_75931/g.210808 Transcript_75931/m.210808 type:complete len:509 (+) Transcript_75931:44-1570(+)